MDYRRALQFIAAILVSFGHHVRASVRCMCDALERHFAEFAALPYQDPGERRQWEDLWEAEAEL
jgi:hypothetical protein